MSVETSSACRWHWNDGFESPLKLDHRLDDSRIRREPFGELFEQLIHPRPMGYPRLGVDLAPLHRSDDPLEIDRPGIPCRHQRQFPPMKIRIVECHVPLE